MKTSKIYRFFLLLAFLSLWAAPAAAQFDSELKQGEAQLEAWRLPQAQAIAAKLLRENPKSDLALDLQARVAFYQGRYEEAVRLVEQALAIDSANEQRQALRLLAQRSRDTVKHFKRFESDHFILYLDEQKDGILVPYVLETLEKSYQAIGRAMGFFPAEKVRVEIAPDAPSFNAISTLSLRDIEETGAVGICKFNKVMTISPRALIHGYRWLDSLSHEYLHYVIVGLTNNKAPIWLHEGMARFYETLWRRGEPAQARADYLTPSNQSLLARALARDKFVGFKKMEPSLIYLETPEEVQLAYAEAASAIDFLVHEKGQGGVRNFLSEVAQRPTPEAIEKVMGASFETFEGQWKNFLKGMGLQEIEGSRVRKYKVKGNQKVDEEAVELREIQSVVARNRTHLGDQLWERRRIIAATQEYRRALKASPHSSIILNKLGRVLLHTGKHDEALPYLKKAQELDPDDITTYIQLGRLYRATKHYPEAKAALEEAIQINPFNPTIHSLLYEIYGALGEKERASRSKAVLEKLVNPR